jgi:hypothetical protein
MRIGGLFCIEENPTGQGNDFFAQVGGEDLRFCMSGRCALYYCLEDIRQFRLAGRGEEKPLAYLPAYTCETVIAPYKKAGFELCFYDIDPKELTPRFDRRIIPRLSVLALCGYYGFSSYDRAFVRECAGAGAAIVQDITHSVFSGDGIEEGADYNAGSFRKWLGIPSGGVAVKRRGRFGLPLLRPEEEHIRGRLACFEEQARALRGEAGASGERAVEIFWETEMRLRRIFDAHESDDLSRNILLSFPWKDHVRRRRENYRFILDQNPFSRAIVPVFPALPDGVCPSHLALYSPDRERIQEFFKDRQIETKVYWPFHGEVDLKDYPGAAWIYDHVYTLSIDQRYGTEDMKRLCAAIEEAGKPRV